MFNLLLFADIIKKVANVPVALKSASFSLNAANSQIVFCDSTSNRRPLLNYETMETILVIEEDANEVVPMFSSSELISFGDPQSGSVNSFDTRTGEHVGSIRVPDRCQSAGTNQVLSGAVQSNVFLLKWETFIFTTNIFILFKFSINI